VVPVEAVAAADDVVPVEAVAAVVEMIPVEAVAAVVDVMPAEAVAAVVEMIPVEAVAAVVDVMPVEKVAAVVEVMPVEAVVAVSEEPVGDMLESSTMADLADADLWAPLSARAAWPLLASAVSERVIDVVVAQASDTIVETVTSTLAVSEEPMFDVPESSTIVDLADADRWAPLSARPAWPLLASAVSERVPDLVVAPAPEIPVETTAPAVAEGLVPDELLVAEPQSVVEEPSIAEQPLAAQQSAEESAAPHAISPEKMLAPIEDQVPVPTVETALPWVFANDAEEIDLSDELDAIAAERAEVALNADRFVPHALWMPLTHRVTWPQLQGVFVEAPFKVREPVIVRTEPVVSQIPAPIVKSPPEPTRPPGPDWVELIESLRHDIERLRVERAQALPAVAQAQSKQPSTPTVAAPSHGESTAVKPKRHRRKPPTVQDEWGFFDPEQCGFSALLAKLDEVTSGNDTTTETSA
jgi:hypothetical protein